MATETKKSTKTKTAKKTAKAPSGKAKAVVAPVKKKVATAVAVTPADQFKRWSFGFGILYVLQGLAIVLFGSKAAATVSTQYLSVDALSSDANGHQMLAPAMRHLGDIRLAWIVAALFIVLAAVHVVMGYASRDWRERMLARGINELRGGAMALAGGLMVVVIALLGGISDLATLVLLFVSAAAGCLLGLGAEAMVARNGGKMSRLSHLLCGLAVTSAIVPWLVFAGQIISARLYGGFIPTYLYWLYASTFVLFASGMWLTHWRVLRKGNWADAGYTERAFMVLTFVAATAFAWQVYAGALHA